MMNSPRLPRLSEAAIVQNAAIGVFALWTFGLAYQERDGLSPPMPLAFLVLPIVLHGPTLDLVVSTNRSSGLHMFAGKLGEKREHLLALHSRALALRSLTLESFMLGEQTALMRIDALTAQVWCYGLRDGARVPALPERLRRIAPACERLGHWFAGVSDQQVAHALKVEF